MRIMQKDNEGRTSRLGKALVSAPLSLPLVPDPRLWSIRLTALKILFLNPSLPTMLPVRSGPTASSTVVTNLGPKVHGQKMHFG